MFNIEALFHFRETVNQALLPPWLPVALLTAAAASAFVAGEGGALLVLLASGALVFGLALLLARPHERAFVVPVALAGLAARATVASVLHVALVATGRGGALFQDDAGYVAIGAAAARIAAGGDAAIPMDPSLVNTYLSFVGTLFAMVGPNVAALKLANTGMAVVAALFFYRTSLLLVGDRAARWTLVLMLVFPSLVLWSSLALKDSFVILCLAGVVWSVTAFVRSANWLWYLGVIAWSLPLQSTRQYLFVVLLTLWAPALFLSLLPRSRAFALRASAAALAVTVPLLFLTGSAKLLSPDTFANLEAVRRAMAVGARSAFVEPTQVVNVETGKALVVEVPGVTPDPAQSPRVHVVPLGTTLVYAAAGGAGGPSPSGVVAVRPGDIVIVTSGPAPASAPLAEGSPAPLYVPLDRPTRVSSVEDQAVAVRITRNLAYLPRGALYVLAAPFPWELRTAAELATVPELALWYATVAFAVAGLVIAIRERRWEFAYLVGVAAALAAALSLAEGNVGTLVRHRGMLVPFAVTLASLALARPEPALARTLTSLRILRRRLFQT